MIFLVIGLIVLFMVIVFLSYALIPSYSNKARFFKRRKLLTDKKEIYLTFDDGPSDYTNELLDLLDKYNVKATFFTVAKFANEHKDVIKRMQDENHEIELHSLRHKNALMQGIFETKKDLRESLKIMKKLNVDVHFYRPPWGDANMQTFKELKKNNLKVIIWNVMAEDWEGDTTSEIIANKLKTRVKSGDIICLHDGRGKNYAPKRTIEALKEVIPLFLEEGYVFKKIEDYE